MSKKKIISQKYFSIFSEMKQFDARIYLFYFRWILQEQNPRLSKTQNQKETHPSIEAAIVGNSKGSRVVVGRGTYL
jgi:hypothetical protein